MITKSRVFLVIFLLWLPLRVYAGTYLSAEEATKNIFPALQGYKTQEYVFDNQSYKIFTALADGKIIGWAVMLDEMGKNYPITFLVGVDTQGKVAGVYVLEFRDMFGSEIKRRSFLRQFHGKTSKNDLKVGRNIDAVTGATISSKAAAVAVKKSLKVIDTLAKE